MKTVKDVDKDINLIEQNIRENLKEMTGREFNRNKNKIEKLKHIKLYLENNPSEDFILNEKSRLEILIEKKERQFNYWKKEVAPRNVDPKKYKSIFNKEVGISDANKFLETINYLINE